MNEKSNEIVAIPALLDMMSIEGAVVTIDAMGEAGQRFRLAKPSGMASGGCRAAIAEKIIDKKADYIRLRRKTAAWDDDYLASLVAA